MFFSEPQFLQPYIKDTDTTGNYSYTLFAIHNPSLRASPTTLTPSAQKTFTECSCTSPPTSTTRTFAGGIRCLKWRYSQSPTTACRVKDEVRPGCGSRSATLEDANRSEPLSSEGLLSLVIGHNELQSTQYKGVSQVWAADVPTTRARTATTAGVEGGVGDSGCWSQTNREAGLCSQHPARTPIPRALGF